MTLRVAEFEAVLDAVAEAPPPAFSGGGKWEANQMRAILVVAAGTL